MAGDDRVGGTGQAVGVDAALFQAIAAGDLVAVQAAIAAGADVNHPLGPLVGAIRTGRRKVVDVLLASGADPSRPVGDTSPVLACVREPNAARLAILKRLIAKGAAVHGGPQEPLIAAVCSYFSQASLAVRALLDAGADPNIGFDAGSGERWTPLFHAVLSRKLHIARLLLERGAHPSPPDCGPNSDPLVVATNLNDEPMRELLLSYGAKDRFPGA